MGGIQAREGSIAEVHAVRGGQLILRVAQSQTAASAGSGSGSTGAAHSSLASIGRQSSTLSFIIPFEGRCYILEQSMDVLEKIFVRLCPRELALLCLTCRTMNLVVSQYLAHYAASYGLKTKLKEFYEKNCNLLLPKELVLKDRLDLNSRHDLLLYSAMHQFIGEVKRISLCNVDCFEDRDSDRSRFLFKEKEVALKRDVVVMKSVKALKFSHTFKEVPQGKYVLQVRLRLSNARWETAEQPQYPALVRASTPKKELLLQRIDPHWWSRIEAHQFHSDLENASFIFDRDSDWLFLRLKPIVLKDEVQDLTFDFDDTKNQNWKHGIIWDFLELRSIVQMLKVS